MRAAQRLAPFVGLLLIAQQVASKIARDSLFLTHVSATALPVAMVATGLLSVGAAWLATGGAGRAQSLRLLATTLGLNGALFLGEAALLPTEPTLAAWALFVHVGTLGPVAVSALWLHFAERFRGDGAPAAFASIACGATFGGVLGGIFAERTAAVFSVPALLVTLALASLAMGAGAWHQTRRPALAPPVPARGPDPRPPASALRRHPRLQRMALLLMATAGTTAVADYWMKAEVARAFTSPGSLVAFFSLFHTVTSVAAFGVQVTVARPVLARWGLGGALMALPLTVATLGCIGAFGARLGALVTLRASDLVLTHSLFRSSYEVLYTGVSTDLARRSKPLIDVVSPRVGDLAGSCVVAALVGLFPSWHGVALGLLTAAVGVATAGLARDLGRTHRAAPEEAVDGRGVRASTLDGDPHPNPAREPFLTAESQTA